MDCYKRPQKTNTVSLSFTFSLCQLSVNSLSMVVIVSGGTGVSFPIVTDRDFANLFVVATLSKNIITSASACSKYELTL